MYPLIKLLSEALIGEKSGIPIQAHRSTTPPCVGSGLLRVPKSVLEACDLEPAVMQSPCAALLHVPLHPLLQEVHLTELYSNCADIARRLQFVIRVICMLVSVGIF